MVAAERRGSGGVAADVEDDRVPVQRKGGGNLRREGERLHARVYKVGGYEPYLPGFYEVAPVREPEVGVDHVEVNELDLFARARGLEGKV